VETSNAWMDVTVNQIVSLTIGFAPGGRRIDLCFSKLDRVSNILKAIPRMLAHRSAPLEICCHNDEAALHELASSANE